MEKQPFLNNAIRAQKILLLELNGEKIGEMSRIDALNRARNENLDLMQVGESPHFAICKIVNYESWNYHESKKKQKQDFENRSHDLKTMNFRPAIGTHDFDLKIKKINELLDQDHKVKVCIKLKGRETTMKSVNSELIKNIQDCVKDLSVMEGNVNWNYKEINFILKPIKKSVIKK